MTAFSLAAPLLTEAAPNLLAYARRLMARRRAYSRAMTELSYLSANEMADLGIARCDFPKLAREIAKLD
jgi:uncharacterized protein YjiS (DUF1127 family)